MVKKIQNNIKINNNISIKLNRKLIKSFINLNHH